MINGQTELVGRPDLAHGLSIENIGIEEEEECMLVHEAAKTKSNVSFEMFKLTFYIRS